MNTMKRALKLCLLSSLPMLFIASASAAEPARAEVSNDDPVLRALRWKDGVDCNNLPADPDLAAKLHAIAEGDIAPSVVPLRAASCLTERFSTDARYLAWVTPWFSDAERGGLAFAALSTGVDREQLEPLVQLAPESWKSAFQRGLSRPARTSTP
jgi:hypothetical protein